MNTTSNPPHRNRAQRRADKREHPSDRAIANIVSGVRRLLDIKHDPRGYDRAANAMYLLYCLGPMVDYALDDILPYRDTLRVTTKALGLWRKTQQDLNALLIELRRSANLHLDPERYALCTDTAGSLNALCTDIMTFCTGQGNEWRNQQLTQKMRELIPDSERLRWAARHVEAVDEEIDDLRRKASGTHILDLIDATIEQWNKQHADK